MKKTPLFLTVILLCVAFLAAGCGNGNEAAKNKPAGQGQDREVPGQAVQDNQADNQEQSVKGTLMELMQRNQALQCSFSFQDEQAQMSGQVYTKDNQVRQDAEVRQEGETIQTQMIMKGNDDIYVWNSMQPGQGMKMSMEEVRSRNQNQNQEQNESQGSASQPANLDKEVEYDCSAWDGDEGKFALPENVEFTDMSQFINDMQDMTGEVRETRDINQGQVDDMKQRGCAACGMAPDPEQCRANLGCE